MKNLRIVCSSTPIGFRPASRSLLPSMASVNRTMLKTMSSFSFFAHARMLSASSRFLEKMVEEIPKLNLFVFCSSCMAAMVLPAFSNALRTLRTEPCISLTPSIDTRMEKMMLRSLHNWTTLVSIGMARWWVMPVVLSVSLRSLGNLSIMTRQISTMSLRVVGSPPDSEAFSMSFHSGELNAVSICSSVMSSLRLPRVQLLHISQRASHTNVQWKMKTVGWRGVYFATMPRTRSRGALIAALARYFAA